MMKSRSDFFKSRIHDFLSAVSKLKPKANILVFAMLLGFLLLAFALASSNGYSLGIKTPLAEIEYAPK